MKKNFVRNLIFKTFAYCLIISAIPYSYFLWHAKQGVDAYILTLNFDVKLNYSWLWINHDGEVYLENVRLFKKRKSPIIKAERLKITLPSIFDWLDSREQVVYKTYPNQLQISVIGAESRQPEAVLNTFGIKYKKEHSRLFFPQECISDQNLILPNLYFDFATTFKIQQTADIAQVSFKFKDPLFATIKGNFNINRLFELGVNTSYLSDLTVELDDMTWLQQKTQSCSDKLNLGRNKLTIYYQDFLNKKAQDENLILNKKTTQEISDFFYKPESFDIAFDIEEGTTYSQINFQPIFDFQKRAGLSFALNSREIGDIFNDQITLAPEKGLESLETETSSDTTTKLPKANTTSNNGYISKSKQSLTKYLGSKIKIYLYNGKPHVGYLESIERNQLLLKKLEYRGKSTLPFDYSQIKSIQLLRAEN